MNRATKDSLMLLGLLCIFLGIGLIGFTLYLIPHVFFDLKYPIPVFIGHMSTWLEDHHSITGYWQIAAFMIPPVIGGIILLVFARIITALIEKEATDIGQVETPVGAHPLYDKQMREARIQPKKYIIHPTIKYLIYVVIALLILMLIEFLFYFEFGGI